MTGKRFDIQGVVLYHPLTMLSQPKQTAPRDPAYLDWIRTQPCTACGASPVHAHHHPAAGHSSVGLKTSDYRTVPLCPVCHDRVHRIGKLSFWGETDVELVISLLNVSFALRAL